MIKNSLRPKNDLELQNRSFFFFLYPLYSFYGVNEVTVWIEYVLAENFILDGTLLFLAQRTVRVRVKKWRLSLSALAGGIFALFFPLAGLQGWVSLAAKGAFGIILCLVATDSGKPKEYFLVILFFYLYTFLYGGLLIGTYSLLNIEYQDSAYLLPQSPAAVAVAFLPLFVLISVWTGNTLYKRYRRRKLLYRCKITLEGNSVDTVGLYDTGNGLTYEGEPVCLIDLAYAKTLTTGVKTGDRTVYVHTAAGSEIFKVFQAELQIYSDGKKNIIDKVYFAVSPRPLGKGYGLILQPQVCKED